MKLAPWASHFGLSVLTVAVMRPAAAFVLLTVPNSMSTFPPVLPMEGKSMAKIGGREGSFRRHWVKVACCG